MSAVSGKGDLRGIIDPEGPFLHALGTLGDFMALNLLFILTSLPVVTVGASASALCAAVLRIFRKEDAHIAREYFRDFWKNFWPCLGYTLIFLAVAAGLYVDVRVMQANSGAFSQLMWIPIGIVALLLALAAPYTFAVQARFSNTFFGTLKNAVSLSLANLPRSVLIAVLTFLPLGLFLFSTYYFLLTSLFWFLGGFSACAAGSCALLRGVFARFEQPEG